MNTQTPTKQELFAHTLRHRSVRVFAVVLVLVFIALLPPVGKWLGTDRTATAATTSTLNFQARLQNAGGAIVPDGTYNIEFNLYTVSSGGSTLWTEDYLNN